MDCPVDPDGIAGCNGPVGAPVAGGYTYGDLAAIGDAVHNGGVIWDQTLWDIRTALGRLPALALITGGDASLCRQPFDAPHARRDRSAGPRDAQRTRRRR